MEPPTCHIGVSREMPAGLVEGQQLLMKICSQTHRNRASVAPNLNGVSSCGQNRPMSQVKGVETAHKNSLRGGGGVEESPLCFPLTRQKHFGEQTKGAMNLIRFHVLFPKPQEQSFHSSRLILMVRLHVSTATIYHQNAHHPKHQSAK